MTRKELARILAKKRKTTIAKANQIIDAFAATITEALEQDDKVVYSNFGTFYTVHYPSKVIIHPKLGLAKKMIMLPTNVAKWMPSENIKAMVNKGIAMDHATAFGISRSNIFAEQTGSNTTPPVASKQNPVKDIQLSEGEESVPIKITKSQPAASPELSENRKTEEPIRQLVDENTVISSDEALEPRNLAQDKSQLGDPSVLENISRDDIEKNKQDDSKKPVNIYEELMKDGDSEVSTFKDSIRIPKDRSKPFWSRIFSNEKEAAATDGIANDNAKVSLRDAGIFGKSLGGNAGFAPAEAPAINTAATMPATQAEDGLASSDKNSPASNTTNKNLQTQENAIQAAPLPTIEKDLAPFPTAPLDIAYVDLSKTLVPKEVLQKVPEKLARRYQIAPVEETETTFTIAMVDPEDIEAREMIKKAVQKPLAVKLATESDISHVLDQYSGFESEMEEAIESVDDEVIKPEEEEKSAQSLAEEGNDSAPAARIVSSLLKRAIRDKASDIHIEPQETEVQVRFRLDGILRKKTTLPRDIQSAVISRIKILSNLKIDEQRLPQDGRFSIKMDNRKVDFRISTMPTAYGEKVVMRILDKMTGILTVEQLGMTGSGLKTLEENLSRSHGMVLVTGPTGSGKTTTLYALIDKLFEEGVNIVTLEDPIEYQMPGINQSQVNAEIDYTFASGLRSIVRQDPDIIMIGEIRDGETAEMAVQAALTGHVVLSTLHTNDAAGAAPRLIDMGVEPFLLTSSVNAIIGQRLARKLCEECKEEVKVPETELATIQKIIEGMPENEKKEMMSKKLSFYHGKGCKNCDQSGHKGRIGIFEVLGVDEEMRDLVLQKVSSSKLQEEAVKMGMVTMLQDGIIKASQGLTSLEEVWRVTKE